MFSSPGDNKDNGKEGKKSDFAKRAEQFNQYIELSKKLNIELVRDKQLSDRLYKLWDAESSFNQEYLTLSKKYAEASEEEMEKLEKVLDLMYIKSEKFSKIIGIVLDVLKTNDPNKTAMEIQQIEDEWQNELDYDPSNPLSTHEERNKDSIYDKE